MEFEGDKKLVDLWHGLHLLDQQCSFMEQELRLMGGVKNTECMTKASHIGEEQGKNFAKVRSVAGWAKKASGTTFADR
jgi:hypothetical protein